MDGKEFLKKHLQCFEETTNYCTGRYIGSVQQLIESFIATTNTVYRRASIHRRGKSKRLKEDVSAMKNLWFQHENGSIPIPFIGYLFEIQSSETWSCSFETNKQKTAAQTISTRKRSSSGSIKCPAAIQVRTIKLFTDYVIRSKEKTAALKKEQERLKTSLREQLENGEEPNCKIVSYCRFPLECCHICNRNQDISSHRMDRRVAKKIRELANKGFRDVESVKPLLSDYVRNTLFAHLDEKEVPSSENSRYFPTKKVIEKHLKAVGPLKILRATNIESPQLAPLVLDLPESRKETTSPCLENAAIGFIAVHGGAGFHSDDRWPGYQRLCSEACQIAMTCLKQGGTAGEAVTCAVRTLEDSDLTNAGFGSNLTEDGNVECDAGVMDASRSEDGRSTFGAVTGVSRIKNPVCAAYKLATQQITNPKLSLGRVPPCVMSGEGSEKWAKANQVEMCDQKHLISEASHKTWQKYHRKLFESLTSKGEATSNAAVERLDTVGAIAIDVYGNVASAASSGGLLMKLPGRVGQAAMFGCGCWAENGREGKPSVAVATSGCGEQLMYSSAAMQCANNLHSCDEPYVAMQQTLLDNILNSPLLSSDASKLAGLLALHHSKDTSHSITELVWGHTTKSFLIGHMSSKDTKPEVLISRLPESATPGKSLSVSGTWVKVAMETNEPSSNRMQTDVNPASVAQFDGASDNNLSVDHDISLMYVSTDVDGLTVKDCVVKLSEEFNRKVDEEFELKIAARWQERQRNNPRLFNGMKFRIDSVEEVGEKLEFRLGLTCYKDYMETNWSLDATFLREKGERLHGNPQVYLADPLGVAGVLVTSDGQVIFHRRNHWVAEAAGKLDVPGGHPEPTDAAKRDKTTAVQLHDLHPDDVINEVFSSQLKEVRDEVNLPLETMEEPRLMGLVRNTHSAGRPVCYFMIRCLLSSSEVEKRYKEGGSESDESTEIVFKNEKDLVYLERKNPSFWDDLCPNGKAAVTLYSILIQVKKGKNPFQMP